MKLILIQYGNEVAPDHRQPYRDQAAMYAESPAAFECLYRAHHDWLRHWLCRKLECSERAADLTHDTFLRLLTRQAPVVGEASRALPVTIAKGLVVDHWRRFALEKAYLDAQALLPDTYAPSPESQHEALQTLERLIALLEGLKPKVRDAFQRKSSIFLLTWGQKL